MTKPVRNVRSREVFRNKWRVRMLSWREEDGRWWRAELHDPQGRERARGADHNNPNDAEHDEAVFLANIPRN